MLVPSPQRFQFPSRVKGLGIKLLNDKLPTHLAAETI